MHLILRYETVNQEVLVRDNRTDSGTFLVNRNEALNPRTFYKFSLIELGQIKLKTGDVDLEIVLPNENAGPVSVSALGDNDNNKSCDLNAMLGDITPLSGSARDNVSDNVNYTSKNQTGNENAD